MAMTMAKTEMVIKIRELGVNRVKVRPMLGSWNILYQVDPNHAESIFTAQSKEECEELIQLAAQ